MAKAGSMADALFAKLEDRILSGELPPGSRLPPQKQLALDEDVSRTVVREAVARLEARGIAEARHGSGVYVAEGARYRAFQVTRDEMSDIADVIRLLEMRLAIETEMAALAAMRRDLDDMAALRARLADMRAIAPSPETADEAAAADMRFHLAIARASRNPYYERFVDFLGVRLVPPRNLYLRTGAPAVHADYADKVQREHEAIVHAIDRLDADGARAAARSHMQESLVRHSDLHAAMVDHNLMSGI